MALDGADRKLIEEYLRWWGDPLRAELALALSGADRGERAALAFTKQKDRMPVSPVPAQNRALVNLILGASPDIVAVKYALGSAELPAMLFGTENMSQRSVIGALTDNLVIRLRHEAFPTDPAALWRYMEERALTGARVREINSIGDLTKVILIGDSALVVQGLERGFQLSTQGWDHRQPAEPSSEPVVRGPKEGFVETAAVNLVLLRRRLIDERFRVEHMTVGSRTGTSIYLTYMLELAHPALLDELRKRIQRIKIDSILESGVLQELIEDRSFTPFPLMKMTERPDVAAAELLEGKFALIVDGTPHALIGPSTFNGAMQAAEDYYQRWPMASFIRFLRYLLLTLALLGPSTYIAITTFHQEMLPTDLLLSLAVAREGVPFPAVFEAILMELTFEALREAGVRLPKTVGQTVSIVGALVIGEAAVQAKIVSPVMVIVVSITGVASFVIPNFSLALAIRLLRFPMMILAGIFGIYGIVLGLIAISIHLSALRSFGVPYMSPTMPPFSSDFKDLMIRVPWWAMRKRPSFMPDENETRQPKGQMPQPPPSP